MHERIIEEAEKFKPPYVRIAEKIANDIKEGIYQPKDRIPSSKQLSLQYKVHRSTIKRAFELLRKQEVLKNRKGLGMVVVERAALPKTIAVIIPKGL
jgi:DNA-binding GntR family transcriptional regulator